MSAQFRWTPAVRALILTHFVFWLGVQILLDGYGGLRISPNFYLAPGQVLFEFKIWQLFTYMFFHSLQVGHILFNMLTLWLIGTELEQRWGWKKFVAFYIGSGAGAAFLYSFLGACFHAVFGGESLMVTPVLGASGALFALLLAYGILFGDRILHFMMIFPMKAKHFVAMLAFVEFLSLVSSGVAGGEVAYLAHLAGFASGFVGLRMLASWSKWTSLKPKKNSRLKLVVDNEKSRAPKYWN